MKAYTTAIASAFALALMIQPCPAPPVLIPIIGAAAAVSTAAEAAGGTGAAIAAGAVSGAVAGVVSKHAKRDGASNICMVDFLNGGQPKLEQSADGSVIVHEVPASCMYNLQQWNEDPEIETLNSMFGYVEQMGNTTSVMIYQMPSNVQNTLQGMLTIGTPANAHVRRSIRVKTRAKTRAMNPAR